MRVLARAGNGWEDERGAVSLSSNSPASKSEDSAGIAAARDDVKPMSTVETEGSIRKKRRNPKTPNMNPCSILSPTPSKKGCKISLDKNPINAMMIKCRAIKSATFRRNLML